MRSGGISSLQPGNITGVASLGSVPTTGSAGSPDLTINVGSGASDAAGLNIPAVTRNKIASDRLSPPPSIGGPPTGYRAAVIRLEPNRANTPPPPNAPGVDSRTGPSQRGAGSDSLSPYAPGVVPPVVPFNPGAGWTLPSPSSVPGP
jgi:hypothetical protein